jgi:glycosyltransferase involved in cell wall biosynthesis
MKKICLCITNYKKEEFLERSIRSCVAQIPYEIDIEIFLVNDGSRKFNKKKLLKEFTSINIIDQKTNKGVAYASNLALKKTNSDYFMRVDADDYLAMKSCLLLSSILNDNSDFPFVYGDILQIDKNGNNKILKRSNREVLLKHGAGIMFRAKYLKKIKGYNVKLKNCEDFDIIIRMEKKYGKGYHIPISYYRYYKTKGSHLSNSKNRTKYLKILKKKYEKHL